MTILLFRKWLQGKPPKGGFLAFVYGIALWIALEFCLTTLPPVQAQQFSVTGVFDYTQSQALFDHLNTQRRAYGLPDLAFDYNLEAFAMQRAAELSVVHSHLRPDGSSHPYGENYSIGWPSPAEATTAFMNSTAHRANILDPSYTSVACAVFIRDGKIYWEQLFGVGTDPGIPTGYRGQVTGTRTVVVNDQGGETSFGAVDETLMIRSGSYIVATGASNGTVLQGLWQSQNPSVAVVDQTGKITGISAGSTVVTGTFGRVTKRILVKVDGGQPNYQSSQIVIPAPERPATVVEPTAPETEEAATSPQTEATTSPSGEATTENTQSPEQGKSTATTSNRDSQATAETPSSKRAEATTSRSSTVTSEVVGDPSTTATNQNAPSQTESLPAKGTLIPSGSFDEKGRNWNRLDWVWLILACAGLAVSGRILIWRIQKDLEGSRRRNRL